MSIQRPQQSLLSGLLNLPSCAHVENWRRNRYQRDRGSGLRRDL